MTCQLCLVLSIHGYLVALQSRSISQTYILGLWTSSNSSLASSLANCMEDHQPAVSGSAGKGGGSCKVRAGKLIVSEM